METENSNSKDQTESISSQEQEIMIPSGSSLQMPSSESQSDEGDNANNRTLQSNKQELKNFDNVKMEKSRYEDAIDAVARGIYVDESLCSNEVSSKKEEFATVPNPNNALPPQEAAQGSELISFPNEQTPEPINTSAGKVKPLVKSYSTLLKHKDKLAPKKLEFKKSFTKQSKVYTSSADSEDCQQSRVIKFKSGKPKSQDPRLDLLRLQHMRCETGLWVQCVSCNKWRYLPSISDPQSVHLQWQCSMNTDPNFSSCSIEQVGPLPEEELHMIHAPYSVGSLVWAHMDGFPWWPAMVDDDPDFEQYYWLNDYSDIPTYFNVVFFDSEPVTRAWITPNSLKPFNGKEQDRELCKVSGYGKDYKKRMEVAVRDAERASSMDVPQRLQEFSFIARYLGKVGKKRKNVRKQNKSSKKNLKKHRHEKSNSDESSLCSEDSYELRKAQMLSLSQADDVKVDVVTFASRRKVQENYGSSSQSSYTSSSKSSASSNYSSDDDKKHEDSSFSSASSNSPALAKKNKTKPTKKNCEVKPYTEKNNTKQEKKFKQPKIKKSFECTVKNKTQKSLVKEEVKKNVEKMPKVSKTHKTVLKVQNDSSGVIASKKEENIAEQNPAKESELKKNKPVKPKFNVSNFVKPNKKTDKKEAQTKNNEKPPETQGNTHFSSFKAKKAKIQNNTKLNNSIKSSDFIDPNSSLENTKDNSQVPPLTTEIKPVNESKDKAEEKQTSVISDKQTDTKCAQSGSESKPIKRKLPQFMVPKSKKQATTKNFVSEGTTTSANTDMQKSLQKEKTSKKDDKTDTKVEKIDVEKEKTDNLVKKQETNEAEQAKNDTVVRKDAEKDSGETSVVVQSENYSVEREKAEKVCGSVHEEEKSEGDPMTTVQDSRVEEMCVSAEAGSSVQPQTSETDNRAPPDCSGVIEEVLTNLSDDNLEFFNPSSPLFDMEE